MTTENKAKWTFMVYMAGDNSLSSAGDEDLREMRTVGSTKDINIIVQFDNAGDLGTNRYLVRKDGIDESTVSLGETDSGSPKELNEFIAWVGKTYPADHYALILWSHGSAWAPADLDRIARSVGATDYSPREAIERSSSSMGRTFFHTTWERFFREPSALRAILVDDGSGHSLDTIELGHVLAKAKEDLGQKIDLLGMDACLMSNLEVAFQARPYARYMVASENNEPNDGWPYDIILPKLVGEPGMSAAELAKAIVQAYVKSYVDIHYTKPVIQSAFDLSQIHTVTGPLEQTVAEPGPLDQLADAMINRLPKLKTKIRDAQLSSSNFHNYTLWDIAHFSRRLVYRSKDKVLRDVVENVQRALTQGAGKFVVAKRCNGADLENCKGVSIYLPLLTDVSDYYAQLDFANQHRWAAMLRAYHR